MWHDDKGKKITKTNVSAPQYIDYVMTCCHKYLHDDAVFPTKFGELKYENFSCGQLPREEETYDIVKSLEISKTSLALHRLTVTLMI